MNRRLPAYRGDDPYVFVSYAHGDEAALREIGRLQDDGVNVWYDDGIGAGTEWSESIASAIKGCERFLYFVTPRSVASENCRRELNFALAEHKPVLAVHLEATEVPDGVRLSLDHRQAILKYKLDADRYRQVLSEVLSKRPSTVATPARRRNAVRGVALIVAIGGLVAAAWLMHRADSPPVPGDRIVFSAIAVLPFGDLSGGDLAPLAAAITQQLTTRLDESLTLRVASTAAVTPLVDRGLSLAEIGATLATPLLMRGYLQRAGDRIEIPVEIIRAADGRVLWSDTLLRTYDDPTLVTQFVAGELARFVAAVSSDPRSGPERPEAYRAWLNWHFQAANYRDWQEAKWIEQTIRLAPDYAWAHLDAFDTYFRIAWDGQDRSWIDKARGALDAAIAAGVSEADPGYRDRMGRYLVYLVGDLDAGEVLLRESGSPFYPLLLLDSGIPEPALAIYESLTAQQPALCFGWVGLGFARGMNGQAEAALDAFAQGLRRCPDHPYLLLNQARMLAVLNRTADSEKVDARLAALGRLPAGSALALRGNRARLLAAAGEKDAALAAAEALGKEGWNVVAGSLFLELGDARAAAQFERAAAHPVAGRRFVSSWLHPYPQWAERAQVKPFLESLGYTAAWRDEICARAGDYAAQLAVEMRCAVSTSAVRRRDDRADSGSARAYPAVPDRRA